MVTDIKEALQRELDFFSICRPSPGVFAALCSKALIKERKAHDWVCLLRASVERGEVKKGKVGG